MYILITRTKMSAVAQLHSTFDSAKEDADKHVGDHNAVDGCSSVPTVFAKRSAHGKEYTVSRSTSFGIRSATVRPIGLDFKTSIL